MLNFSEEIILAALGNKSKSNVSLETVKLSGPPSSIATSKGNALRDLSYDEFRDKLKEGVDKSAPLTEEQMKEAFNLLKTGQVKTDIKHTILKLMTEIRELPSHLSTQTEIPNIFRNPLDFPKLPGIKTAGETAKIFIKPDNKTFRLAILVYARTHGINIEEKNLDDLYNYLESNNEADFNALVHGGINTMKDQYGVTDIEQVLQSVKSE